MTFATEPCPDGQAFRFQNGARARSLEEFRRAIQTAPAEVVMFHRDHDQHGVRDVLQDKPLAGRIQHEGQRAGTASSSSAPSTRCSRSRCSSRAGRSRRRRAARPGRKR